MKTYIFCQTCGKEIIIEGDKCYGECQCGMTIKFKNKKIIKKNGTRRNI